jgi:aldose sugar dehydrogenase
VCITAPHEEDEMMMRRSPGPAVVLALAAMACSRPAAAPADQGTGQCTPVALGAPNVPEQTPAFEAQTRACASPSGVAFDVVIVARGLEHPWAVEPLPGGDLLVTERPGRMRIVSADGKVGEPIEGLPAVDARGQGGLLDVALSPSFASDRTIFWSYSEPREGGNATSVARGVLSKDGKRLEQIRVILQAMPTFAGRMHFGSRLVFDQDGMLFVTLGERSVLEVRPQAQHLDSHMGKILRVTPEGKPAPGNPFAGRSDARPEIWTLGHRNVQAATLDPQGRLWIVDHGPRGGDELNLIEKGKNYGWPLVTYGEEYSGKPIPNSVTAREGFEQPVYYWDPVIAPSGAEFYTGDAFPAWRGSLFVGSLAPKRLVRLELKGDRVTGEEHLLTDRDQRIRDVRQGPDGALYIVIDEPKGELWRVAPRR